MRTFTLLLLAAVLLLAACAPRPDVIANAAAATLTAQVPTSSVDANRPTSTPILTALPATATPGPTETPFQEVTPEASPTFEISPTPTLIRGGEVLFEDPFDLPRDWATGETDDAIVALEPGILRFVQKQTPRFSLRITGRTGDDFFTTLAAQTPGTCRQGDRYGLMFRVVDPQNYYLFVIDCAQRHRAGKVVDGVFIFFYDWTLDEAIVSGADAANELGIVADGPNLRFVVNGTQVAAVEDNSFSAGRFGLWVGAESTANFIVLFDQWTIYSLSP